MSQRRGSEDGELPELPPEWRHLVIPDDARELAAEAEVIRAELALEESLRDLNVGGRWGRYGLSGPLVLLSLMLIAAVVSLVVVVTPARRSIPQPAPLANTSGQIGERGGLVPDIVLVEDANRDVSLRQFRPAVLLLVPTGCDCADLVADVAAASRDSMVSVGLIGADRAPALPADPSTARVHALLDRGGALARAVSDAPPVGPLPSAAPPDTSATAILVRADGVITRIARNLVDVRELHGELAGLTIP